MKALMSLWVGVFLGLSSDGMAQVVTNTLQLLTPTNNFVAARSKYPLNDSGRIAPNTPAFEEYGLHFMLGEANKIREVWSLEIQKPLSVHDVLFQLKATAKGLDGGLGTRDKRYDFAFSRNSIELFRDNNYSSFRIGYKQPNELAKLSEIKSTISATEAVAIATAALHGLGLNEKQLGLKSPPTVEQIKYEDSQDKVHFLPLFKVSWRPESQPVPDDDSDFTPVTMEISGITKRIVEYFSVIGRLPPTPSPTNYFQMLNLPTNYLETLPERTRVRWGLPSLTNTTGLGTNAAK